MIICTRNLSSLKKSFGINTLNIFLQRKVTKLNILSECDQDILFLVNSPVFFISMALQFSGLLSQVPLSERGNILWVYQTT